MSIDWPAFTPFSALTGGVLIGVAAAILVLLNGRIAGIAGIVGGLLRPAPREAGWRLAFLGGLIAAPLLCIAAGKPPTIVVEADYPTLVIAGLIVGLGTRYGAGCTSGHGVCGASRLSPRSIVATLAFMASGFATAFVVRHVVVS
ncbi:MAG TPA: YeeE/YedE family protein [Casimicrobiaceae bacterium]|nr:YeeE/YedE family protein [Casimicrobiaceae bacterium]